MASGQNYCTIHDRIPLALLTSSEVLSCAQEADMSLYVSEKFQLVPVRIPSLFEQNVLKAVGRTQTQIEADMSLDMSEKCHLVPVRGPTS